jgi:hypothetical protein
VHVPRVGDPEEVLQLADAGRARGAPERVERAAVEQEAVRRVVVVGVQLQAGGGGALAEDVPPLGGRVPVGLEVAAGRVAAGADVLLPEGVRRLTNKS